MPTGIRPVPRKNGTMTYKAEVRIKEKGKVIFSDYATFSEEKHAVIWREKRMKELKRPGGVENALYEKNKSDETISGLIDEYIRKVKPLDPWGRSKDAVLKYWQSHWLGEIEATELTARHLVDFGVERKGEGAAPATINSDIAFLRSVFSIADDLLGTPVSVEAFDKARPTMTKLKLVGRSEERDRRPTVEEITAIVQHLHRSRLDPKVVRRNPALSDRVIVFSMFSSRRISETCRIEWDDLDTKGKRVLVRDMKDPRHKKGNDVIVWLPDEAMDVINSMPRTDARIFPYNSKTIGTNFTRARNQHCDVDYDNEHNNLQLRDLRHECLSWLAEKNGLRGENWDIARIQKVSGHKNWNVLNRYVNMIDAKPVDKWKKWEWKTKVLEA